MYFSLIILVLFVSGSLTIDCPHSPSKWCETKEIAQACGVNPFEFPLVQFSPSFRLVNNVKLMSGKPVRLMIVSIYRFIMKHFVLIVDNLLPHKFGMLINRFLILSILPLFHMVMHENYIDLKQNFINIIVNMERKNAMEI